MDTTLLFLGDTHSELAHIIPCIRKEQAAGRVIGAVVFLGDIVDHLRTPLEDLLRPIEDAADAPVRLIFGNHECDDAENWANCQSAAARNLDGRVEMLAGVRIGGLGGVFRSEIWYPKDGNAAPHFATYDDYVTDLRRRQPPRIHHDPASAGKLLKHRASIFPEVVERLWEYPADVLVSHEAPGMGLHRHGFDAVAELAEVMGVRHSFHGHHHDCLDRHYATLAEKLGFTAHGVGLRGITALDTKSFTTRALRFGEKDAERQGREA